MHHILTHFEAEKLFEEYKKHQTTTLISLDLGKSQEEVTLASVGVILPDGQVVSWKSLKKVLKHKNRCYFVKDGALENIAIFSETTGWMRTLYPTTGAPTTLVSGILMHRIKDIDPLTDARQKVAALGNLNGALVLDTSTGLGYSSLEMAKSAKKVVSVEIDPAAFEIIKLNPWSKQLFELENVEIINKNLLEVITDFKNNQFTHIFHDPPTLKLTGELYSEELYNQFFRILTPGGKLFHYIGDPDSEHGSITTKGVIRRLASVGFTEIREIPGTFGVIAQK